MLNIDSAYVLSSNKLSKKGLIDGWHNEDNASVIT